MPFNLDQFIQVGLPVSLALIMLSLGLTLKPADFYTLRDQPRSVMLGLFAQLVLVPLLALVVVIVFDLPPLLAVGLMILSFCPGGVTSNWFSYLALGNLPLSIGLTVLASLITPFTIPILSELALQQFLGESRTISIPIGQTMLRLLAIAVVPVALGMLVRARCVILSNNWYPIVYRVATISFLSVIAALIFRLGAALPAFIPHASAASLSMIVLALGLGALIARVARLPGDDRRTIAIEVGMQNGGMALVVTQGILQNQTISVVPVVYGLIMLLPVFSYSRWARRSAD